MRKTTDKIKLITLSNAAGVLNVSQKTLHRMIKQGKLPAFKVGGQWRIRESQLSQWIENMESAIVASE